MVDVGIILIIVVKKTINVNAPLMLSNAKKRYSKSLDVSENKADEVWRKLSETAEVIDNARIEYDNLDGESFNSNSVIKTILEENKLKAELPGISKDVAPGWENNLSSKSRYQKIKNKRN